MPPQLKGQMPYTAPPFTIPGIGTVQLMLAQGNMTAQTRIDGKPLLIRGGTFPANFIVEVPAMQPTPTGPVPDPAGVKPGMAQFVTTNETMTAS